MVNQRASVGEQMTEEQEMYLSEEELAAFASKLEAWGETLPPKERALLNLMVDRMAGDDDGELSDEDLESVAGGISFGAFGQRTFTSFSKVLKRESFDVKQGMFAIVGPAM